MIWSDCRVLVALYWQFFIRKIFNVGILRDKRNKILFGCLFVIATITMSVLFYLFLDGSRQLDKNYRLIINVYGITTMLYTVLVFMFLKVLFLKSSHLNLLTVQLPVSNHVRRSSLLCFEMYTIFISVMLLALSFLFALVGKTGGKYVLEILMSIVFTSITTYNLLNVSYLFFFWVLEKLSVKVSQYFLSIILFTILVVLFVKMQPIWIDILIKGYFDKTTYFVFPLIFVYIAQRSDVILSVLSFLGINGVFVYISFYLFTDKPIDIKKYSKFFFTSSCSITLFKSYFIQVFRFKENALVFLLTVLTYLIGSYHQVAISIFVFLFLSFNSAYALINTKSLSMLQKTSHTYSAIKEYGYLLTSNVVYVLLLSIPFVLLELVVKQNLLPVLFFLGSIIPSVIYLLMIGILFPPIHDNPVSIFIGSLFLMMMTVLLLLVTVIFKLSLVMEVVSMFCFTILIMYRSVCVLKKYERIYEW